MKRILFLDTKNDARSIMAAEFLRANSVKYGDVEAESAGLVASEINSMAIRVMGELGIDVSNIKSTSFDQLENKKFDVIVTMSQEAAEKNFLFIGHPQQVNWLLNDPTAIEGEENAVYQEFIASRDHVIQLIDDLMKRGYFDALCSALRCESLILDNVLEGIIAHDLNRKITVFNTSAERITGYNRNEVLGRDCHEVFPGFLCGGKCVLPDGPDKIQECTQQELRITMKNGDERIVQRTVRGIIDIAGKEVGAMVIFCDITYEKVLARQVEEVRSFSGIIGQDKKMLEMFDLISDLAQSDVSVLIQGASGTGKELVAAAIHNEGSRANKLFVPVNCGALPETLLESELFGHVKGAFTGAIRNKKGRFELADGGTIFLDEIGDITPAMQVKLLRVLQEGCFEKVGGEETIYVNVRVVSATNKDLVDEIAKGKFREDLYYRLNVVPVYLPLLRERRNDIPLITDFILNQALEGKSQNVKLSHEAMGIMMSYDWPGNVRELQNWIQFALIRCKGDVILPEHLPPMRISQPKVGQVSKPRCKLNTNIVNEALTRTGGNKVKAARMLGISRATLYRFLDSVESS